MYFASLCRLLGQKQSQSESRLPTTRQLCPIPDSPAVRELCSCPLSSFAQPTLPLPPTQSSNTHLQTNKTMVSYPQNFGYVVLVGAAMPFLTTWMSLKVSKARKLAQIKYPNCYASHEQAEKDPLAKKFNCAQRAHANCLEELPTILFTLVVCGLEWPIFSAASGAMWILGRIMYTNGYISGDPAKRVPGSMVHHAGSLPLAFGAAWAGIKLIKAGL
ncbi:MAPEG-domain-containing protein [Meredithblackwellia eburnea MCA 4105]